MNLVMTTARLQRSRKMSRSGYRIPELYVELESALLARDHERGCALAAELACTAGGQTRSVISFLLDTYSARCVNSGRAQMNLLHVSLAHLGSGTSRSPNVSACNDVIFRRGLCTLTLLVACARVEERSVEAAFARVPRSEQVPSLNAAIEALRASTMIRDAHAMSAVIRAIPDEAWFTAEIAPPEPSTGAGLPDVLRLRAAARKHAVWHIWTLACELAKEAGVSEFVEHSLHAFSWGYSSLTARNRIHLLWYAFLVIVKGAPRSGPHPIELTTFERALQSIDTVFLRQGSVPQAAVIAPAAASATVDYLTAITRHDSSRAWEVEKDRLEAREKCSDTRVISLHQRREA